ncbi:MAG: hypothetical protein ACR2PR_09375 [Pseudohongiellaceae bacterium]
MMDDRDPFIAGFRYADTGENYLFACDRVDGDQNGATFIHAGDYYEATIQPLDDKDPSVIVAILYQNKAKKFVGFDDGRGGLVLEARAMKKTRHPEMT